MSEISTCGKTAYNSRGAALAGAVRFTGRNTSMLRVYFCRRCEGWHLTSKPRTAPSVPKEAP